MILGGLGTGAASLVLAGSGFRGRQFDFYLPLQSVYLFVKQRQNRRGEHKALALPRVAVDYRFCQVIQHRGFRVLAS